MNRRGFLAGILAAGAAPAIVRAEILMPLAPRIWVPAPLGVRGFVNARFYPGSTVTNADWMEDFPTGDSIYTLYART